MHIRVPLKVETILYHTVNLNSLREYKKILKKRLKAFQRLNIEYDPWHQPSTSKYKEKMRCRLVKLLKNFKPIKVLDLHNSFSCFNQVQDTRLITLAKCHYKIKTLSLSLRILSPEVIAKHTLWLRYLGRLKRLDCCAPKGFQYVTPTWTQKEFRRFFGNMRRNRLEILNFSPKNIIGLDPSHIMQFKKCPSTLKKFAFDCQPAWSNIMVHLQDINASLRLMKTLTVLSLCLPAKSQLWDLITNSVSNPKQLEGIYFRVFGNFTPINFLPRSFLKDLDYLRSVGLEFDGILENFKDLLEILSRNPLKTFILKINIETGRETDLHSLSRCLDSFTTKLETLSLSIFAKWSSEEAQVFFYHLMNQIPQFTCLKELKIHLFEIEKYGDYKKLSNLALPSNRLFCNPSLIEKFSFKCDHLKSEMLVNLITFCKESHSNLRKLAVDVGSSYPSKAHLNYIKEFIQKLKKIETLRLRSLSITTNTFLEDIASSVCNLPFLKKLELGEIERSIKRKSFMSSLEKILSKKGLREFTFVKTSGPKLIKEKDQKRFYLVLQNAMKTNSDLEKWPCYNYFSEYYDKASIYRWEEEESVIEKNV